MTITGTGFASGATVTFGGTAATSVSVGSSTTITATAAMAGLNPITYLTAYLDTCGRAGGKPLAGPDLERFLPWAATPDDLDAWKQPPRPG